MTNQWNNKLCPGPGRKSKRNKKTQIIWNSQNCRPIQTRLREWQSNRNCITKYKTQGNFTGIWSNYRNSIRNTACPSMVFSLTMALIWLCGTICKTKTISMYDSSCPIMFPSFLSMPKVQELGQIMQEFKTSLELGLLSIWMAELLFMIVLNILTMEFIFIILYFIIFKTLITNQYKNRYN